MVVDLLCRAELTAVCRAARLVVCRLEDGKDLELLALLVDDDLEEAALLAEDALEVVALLWVLAADVALAARLFFWKPDAAAMLKPTIPKVRTTAIVQTNALFFVLSTCHFMTCTPICPVIFSGFSFCLFCTNLTPL